MDANTYKQQKGSWTTTSPPICTDMNNYVKLYDYTKILVEFYIANKNQRQGLHHASRAAAAKTRRLPPPLPCEPPPHAAKRHKNRHLRRSAAATAQ